VTQSIEARAQQEGCMQACTIRLSINEDLKLEKKERRRRAAPFEIGLFLYGPLIT